MPTSNSCFLCAVIQFFHFIIRNQICEPWIGNQEIFFCLLKKLAFVTEHETPYCRILSFLCTTSINLSILVIEKHCIHPRDCRDLTWKTCIDNWIKLVHKQWMMVHGHLEMDYCVRCWQLYEVSSKAFPGFQYLVKMLTDKALSLWTKYYLCVENMDYLLCNNYLVSTTS